MLKSEFFELYDKLLESVRLVGRASKYKEFKYAHKAGSEMLDYICALGVRLGYLDPKSWKKII